MSVDKWCFFFYLSCVGYVAFHIYKVISGVVQ